MRVTTGLRYIITGLPSSGERAAGNLPDRLPDRAEQIGIIVRLWGRPINVVPFRPGRFVAERAIACAPRCLAEECHASRRL